MLAAHAPSAAEEPAADLLPMSVADAFDAGFDIYKRNFSLFAGIAAIVHVPSLLIINLLLSEVLKIDPFGVNTRASGPEADPSVVLGIMALGFVLSIVYGFLWLLEGAAVVIAGSDRYLGRRISIGTAYLRALPSFLPLIVNFFLIGIIVGVCAFMSAIVASMMMVGLAAAASGTGPFAAAIAIVMVIVVVLIPTLTTVASLLFFGAFVPQIVTLEQGGFVALGRNITLIGRRFLPLLGSGLLLFLLYYGLALTLQEVFIMILRYFVYPFIHMPPLAQHVIESVWSAISTLIIAPLPWLILTVLYYDHRVRREGFDIAMLEYRLRTEPQPGGAS